jgi:predicted transcriptional regulator of viral defense system
MANALLPDLTIEATNDRLERGRCGNVERSRHELNVAKCISLQIMSCIMEHVNKSRSEAECLLKLAEGREVLPLSAIRDAGLSRAVVTRVVRDGRLERVGRGLYRRPDAPVGEHHDLVAVFARVNKAVVVLLSALRFHELGTQRPNAVWIQLPASARVPKMEWPPLRVVRTRVEALFTEGVDRHVIGGIEVPITNPARTVVDCFKYRNQVGLDVCIEALKELIRRDRNVMDPLYRYATINRVRHVMQPYLEGAV